MAVKKSIYELAKEFPNKTYIQLEKYRDADRNEEAQRIITQQENEELTESQQKQEELEPIGKGKEIDYHRYWKDQYEEAKEKIKELNSNLERVKKENNDLYNRIAKLSEKNLQKARESGL
jgi:uncharacterized coiled-coil DUF342 family protein